MTLTGSDGESMMDTYSPGGSNRSLAGRRLIVPHHLRVGALRASKGPQQTNLNTLTRFMFPCGINIYACLPSCTAHPRHHALLSAVSANATSLTVDASALVNAFAGRDLFLAEGLAACALAAGKRGVLVHGMDVEVWGCGVGPGGCGLTCSWRRAWRPAPWRRARGACWCTAWTSRWVAVGYWGAEAWVILVRKPASTPHARGVVRFWGRAAAHRYLTVVSPKPTAVHIDREVEVGAEEGAAGVWGRGAVG